MKPPYRPFKFQLDPLPKEVYATMQAKRGDLSQWQYIVAALKIMEWYRDTQPDHFAKTMAKLGYAQGKSGEILDA